ncbi:unnamed protein product, partial [Mesorhabditis spiculigera]
MSISGRRPPAVELLEGLAGSEGDLSGPPLAKKLRYALYEARNAKLIILEEKFFELLSKGENTLAMKLMPEEYIRIEHSLRTRRTELHPEIKKFDSRDAHWRRRLAIRVQKQLDPAYMLPCKRLEQLTDQAFKYQVRKCRLHLTTTTCGAQDGTLSMWSADSAKPVAKLDDIHRGVVNSVRWSPCDTAMMISVGDDKHLRVFTANLVHCADSRRARPQRAAHLSANGVGGHRSTPIPQLDSGHKKKPVNQLDYLRLQAVARARGLIFSNPGYAI